MWVGRAVKSRDINSCTKPSVVSSVQNMFMGCLISWLRTFQSQIAD
jgi:hypothetical protein